MPTALSINVNKIALLRNSRGENRPNLITFSENCLKAGADGITVHPRPDQRHIRFDDLEPLKALTTQYKKEFNIEGYPSSEFLDQVIKVKPDQVTLVPDPPHALTSSFGWNTKKHQAQLLSVLSSLKSHGIRTSLFVDHTVDDESLAQLRPDRVELYTYDYAHLFEQDREQAISPYIALAERMNALKIALNAGHDLNQHNTAFFLKKIPTILEVSIGHAFICDCIDEGFEKTIKAYCEAVK